MGNFINEIKEKAKKSKRTIVLPEVMDRRILEATEIILKEGIADIILVGREEEISVSSRGLDISGVTIINPYTFSFTYELINSFYELRKSKGMTLEKAREILLNDYMYFACMLVKEGYADGVVSGACHSTSDTLRPALQILKTKPNVELVSSFFLMDVPNCCYGDNGTFVFADCGLEQNPTSEKC